MNRIVSLGAAAPVALLPILLGLGPAPSRAESSHFRRYSVEQGLGQSQVLAMLEDRTGHVWFATNGGGLTRFDGSSFHTFTMSDGLSSNLVYTLAEDGAGILWVGTDKGLDRFDGSSFSSFSAPELPAGEPVWTLAVAPGGEMLAGVSAGLVEIGAAGARLLVASSDLPHARINGLAVRDDAVWLSNLTGGFCRYQAGGLECWQPGRIGDQVRWVGAVIPRRSGGLWIGTDQSVFAFDDGAFSAVGCVWAPTEYVFGLVEDRLSRLWVATNHGVRRYAGRDCEFINKDSGLQEGAIGPMLEDREGSMWFAGMYGGGVSQLVAEWITYYGESDGLGSVSVYSVLRAVGGHLLVGTSKGVSIVEPERAPEETSADAKLKANLSRIRDLPIMDILENAKGDLWFASPGGPVHFDGESLEIRRIGETVEQNMTSSILETPEGDLWFATGDGVARLTAAGTVRRYGDDELGGIQRVHGLSLDSAGGLWLGTDSGVLRFDRREFTRPPGTEDLARWRVYSLAFDSAHGAVWLGTYGGGVACYRVKGDGGSLQWFDHELGLTDNGVTFLQLDADGHLWVGTNKGLNRLDTGWCRGRPVNLRTYTAREGFAGSEANQNASLLDRDGSLWFGTIGGLLHFEPRQDLGRPPDLATRIVGVELDRRPYDWRAAGHEVIDGRPLDLELRHDQNTLGIRFAAVSLRTSLLYRYRLLPIESQFSPPTDSMQAIFPALAPGRYTFEVYACTGPSQCESPATAYPFTIRPPWWKTTWFKALVPGVALFLGGMANHARTRRLQRRQKELEAQVQLRTASLERAQQELQAANAKLERLSVEDGLTGLANRRAFDEWLAREWHRADREGTGLALILLDVDFFKLFNDLYGHPAGDECLRRAGAVLKESARRPGDLAARVGGEEFALILPGATVPGAQAVADRVRAGVEAMAIAHGKSAVAPHVTASLGLCFAVPQRGGTSEALVAAADQALYLAKARGRNRVAFGRLGDAPTMDLVA